MFDIFMLGIFLGILKVFAEIKIISVMALAGVTFGVVLDNNDKASSLSTPIIELKNFCEIIVEIWLIKIRRSINGCLYNKRGKKKKRLEKQKKERGGSELEIPLRCPLEKERKRKRYV